MAGKGVIFIFSKGVVFNNVIGFVVYKNNLVFFYNEFIVCPIKVLVVEFVNEFLDVFLHVLVSFVLVKASVFMANDDHIIG